MDSRPTPTLGSPSMGSGPITASAVRGTQELNNALVDGIVWMQTWAIAVHAAGQVTADLCGVPGPRLATWHFIGLRPGAQLFTARTPTGVPAPVSGKAAHCRCSCQNNA